MICLLYSCPNFQYLLFALNYRVQYYCMTFEYREVRSEERFGCFDAIFSSSSCDVMFLFSSVLLMFCVTMIWLLTKVDGKVVLHIKPSKVCTLT